MKHEWRKAEKNIYLPKRQPVKIELHPMKYFTIKGADNPNSEGFSEAVGALYGMAYGVKMAPKKGKTPAGYFDYTVYPLEGFWSLNDVGIQQFKEDQTFNKEDLIFKIMIRQPDFVTSDFALEIMEDVSKRKPNEYNERIKFEVIEEGLCLQALHVGSYDTENNTFSIMDEYCKEHKLKRLAPYHKEIYLSDPRKTMPEKNKTTLRFSVKEI